MKTISATDLPRYLQSHSYIIGIDEVGNGAICGSVMVCGVRASTDWILAGLKDSKKISAKKRENLSQQLRQVSDITFSLIEKDHLTIDQQGLGQCMSDAYYQVINELCQPGDLIIMDGDLHLKERFSAFNIICLPKADDLVPHVSAASILAKVVCDQKILQIHQQYPQYQLDSNKGYATPLHKEAIKQLGLSPFHRTSVKLK